MSDKCGTLPPTQNIEASSPETVDSSGASEAVYCIITDIATGKSDFIVGQLTYMQQNVTDPSRPQGHLTVEFFRDSRLGSWNAPHDKIASEQRFMLKESHGAKFVWWRSIIYDLHLKRRTCTAAGGQANTGDLIFYQNSPKDS